MNEIITSLATFTKYDWLANIFSIIYIWLAVKNKSACFIFGLLASACWAYVSLVQYNLLFDCVLQGYYGLMSVYGIVMWSKGSDNPSEELKITNLTLKDHVKVIVVGFIIGLLLAYIVDMYFLFDKTYIDSLTTSYLILATFLLVKRKLENWIYFIVCDLIYAFYIYPSQGAYLFSIMMIIFTFMAVLGYIRWKSEILNYVD